MCIAVITYFAVVPSYTAMQECPMKLAAVFCMQGRCRRRAQRAAAPPKLPHSTTAPPGLLSDWSRQIVPVAIAAGHLRALEGFASPRAPMRGSLLRAAIPAPPRCLAAQLDRAAISQPQIVGRLPAWRRHRRRRSALLCAAAAGGWAPSTSLGLPRSAEVLGVVILDAGLRDQASSPVLDELLLEFSAAYG